MGTLPLGIEDKNIRPLLVRNEPDIFYHLALDGARAGSARCRDFGNLKQAMNHTVDRENGHGQSKSGDDEEQCVKHDFLS
jgi:hypothetical protein